MLDNRNPGFPSSCLEKEIGDHWAKFIENDLPAIKAVFKVEQWIWADKA